MIHLVKHIIRKLLLNRMFKRYVVSHKLIQEDIATTIGTRGCVVTPPTLRKHFFHLMLYYPEYAMIFFWRIRKRPWYYGCFAKDFHCKIFKSTKIEGGLMCYHPYATVINAKSIGKNFQFRNGLTIGNKNNDNTQLPTIGNHVTVGAQVAIIGAITIGDHVEIGAGSVVVKDMPSHCIVAGNPAVVLKTLPNG